MYENSMNMVIYVICFITYYTTLQYVNGCKDNNNSLEL